MLERLTPAERAVFVLRDVFEYPYAEVAAILQLSEANCRQLLRRAKAQIAAHRAHFSAPAARHQALVERFLTATERGDVAGLIQLLAEDVVFEADSGGKAQAPLRPVQGGVSIAKLMPIYLANVVRLVGGDRGAIRSQIATINGELAVLTWIREQLDSITVLSVTDDRISALRLIRNPEKLQHVRRQLQLDARAPS